ncbi:MAG TPA: hypothetical protein VHS76_06740 [Steroidobacteraceae bacterium]|nr:hypothetical protein [Steroidobacteraceae bacterium]
MSALENAMRVNSEKQTLILAGEPVPQRSVGAGGRTFAYSDSQRPLTIIATPVDDPKLLETTAPARKPVFAAYPDLSNAHGAAGAYARTQALSGSSTRRSALIDTYA